jgi:FkbM family methyltransferase
MWARGLLEPELFAIPSVIPADRRRRAVDVGAHYGIYTFRLARLFGRVEAFEPQPTCADVIAARAHPRVHVHRTALSSADRGTRVYVPLVAGHAQRARATLSSPAGPSTSITTSASRLDGEGYADLDFMKIDVEGHELDVLGGARETIRRCQPLLLVEVERRHLPDGGAELVFERLGAWGYTPYRVLGGKLLPTAVTELERFQPPALQREAERTGKPPRHYVNNFFFIPRDWHGYPRA